MFVRTAPREMTARWIRAGDEVALLPATADKRRRVFLRSSELADDPGVEWWLLVDGSHLVRPPASLNDPTRIEGLVRHSAGGFFDVEPMPREPVPKGLDHTGTHTFVMCPILSTPVPTLGEPRTFFAQERHQIVVRERVRIAPMEYVDNLMGGLNSAVARIDAVAIRRLLDEAHEEGQRTSAGTTAAEFARVIQLASDEEERGSAGDLVPIPIPADVMGESLGRELVESEAVDFRSARDSDPA